jgi:hypothetical protein
MTHLSQHIDSKLLICTRLNNKQLWHRGHQAVPRQEEALVPLGRYIVLLLQSAPPAVFRNRSPVTYNRIVKDRAPSRFRAGASGTRHLTASLPPFCAMSSYESTCITLEHFQHEAARARLPVCHARIPSRLSAAFLAWPGGHSSCDAAHCFRRAQELHLNLQSRRF